MYDFISSARLSAQNTVPFSWYASLSLRSLLSLSLSPLSLSVPLFFVHQTLALNKVKLLANALVNASDPLFSLSSVWTLYLEKVCMISCLILALNYIFLSFTGLLSISSDLRSGWFQWSGPWYILFLVLSFLFLLRVSRGWLVQSATACSVFW